MQNIVSRGGGAFAPSNAQSPSQVGEIERERKEKENANRTIIAAERRS
jgi:hypothetical protein